jgi:hypothetical protein
MCYIATTTMTVSRNDDVIFGSARKREWGVGGVNGSRVRWRGTGWVGDGGLAVKEEGVGRRFFIGLCLVGAGSDLPSTSTAGMGGRLERWVRQFGGLWDCVMDWLESMNGGMGWVGNRLSAIPGLGLGTGPVLCGNESGG